jgi:hypothetical protein
VPQIYLKCLTHAPILSVVIGEAVNTRREARAGAPQIALVGCRNLAPFGYFAELCFYSLESNSRKRGKIAAADAMAERLKKQG